VRLLVKPDLALAVLRIALIAALLPLAVGWRTPFLASWRHVALAVLLALPLLLIALEVWTLRRAGRRAVRLASGTSLLLALIAFGATAAIELSFRYQRAVVLAADRGELERLGRHFLIGYRRSAELQALLDRRAVAGVFISALNVEGRSRDQVRRRIDEWQALRRAQNLPPLWVATDQEGGPVSRVSPPLMRQSSLAEVVALHADPAERIVALRHYAAHQGRELSSLGVNLNFAPVVDLNHGVHNPEDRLSRISSRAISTDPAVVTQVAGLYCATLLQTGVHCTLKHFPGLGRVYEDTHRVTAKLATPAHELEQSDWMPFRQVMAQGAAFTMLSHARLTEIDRDRPASFSSAVVKGLLRGTWKHDGILVTDDFSMGAVTFSDEGAAGGAVAALNAGVDLLLVSYDPDQYFPMMYALLAAAREGRLRSDMLEASAARLRWAAPPLNSASLRAR
jgi:beta-N-acetylhexosaminidase